MKTSWLSYSMSLYLCGKYAEAERVLVEFLSIYPESKPASISLAAYEVGRKPDSVLIFAQESELLLFLGTVIQKQEGQEERALAHLETIIPKVKDMTGWRFLKGLSFQVQFILINS